MSEPTQAIEFVLNNEKGISDNKNDAGGATNFGVSLRFLKLLPDERLRKYGIFTPSDALIPEDVFALTQDQAKNIYRGEFWDSMPFQNIFNQHICNYIFDSCVLHGTSQGIKILQRALCAVFRDKDFVKDDGVLGEKTCQAEQKADLTCLIVAVMTDRAGLMRTIAQTRNDKEFINGWLARCYRI